MIVFTPLCGSAQSTSVPNAFCYLLQIDDIRVLLDCGAPDWRLGAGEDVEGEDEAASRRETKKWWSEYLSLLTRTAPEIDLVLFTHGSLQHIGLYSYARAKLGLSAPAFATLPVQALGRIAVLEDVEGWRAEVDVDNEVPEEYSGDGDVKMESGIQLLHKAIATADVVKEAFDSITTLKYSQATQLTGKLQALTLTAYSASHTLGGTLWKLRSASSGTLLYAVGLNHMKEQHLDGTALVRPGGGGVGEGLGRPDLLITDAGRVGIISVRRREREEAFLESITNTLRSSGSVLIPVDASTRLVELLIILDQHWTQAKTRAPLCLVSRTGKECVTFVRSLMEWMGGWITREGEVPTIGKDSKKRKRRNRKDEEDIEEEDALLANMILRFKHLQIFPSPEALMDAIHPSAPKVILATPLTMSHGASRAMFESFSSMRNNLLLLVNIAEKGTLARSLWDIWQREQAETAKWGKGRLGAIVKAETDISVRMNAKVPLAGVELEEYLNAEKAAKEKAAAEAAARPQLLLEADDDDEGDSEDEASDASSELAVEEELGGGTDEGVATRHFAEGSGAKGAGAEEEEADSARQQLSFDIYLKGKVARATFFKSSSGAQATRYRMFPYVEKRRRIDEWGETIDVGTWMRRGKKWEEEEETEENQAAKEARRKRQEEEQAQHAPPEPPSKYITEQHSIDVRCKVYFVDFEGLNDGRATKMIVPQVNPRKMILVASQPEATAELMQACGEIRSMTREISTPGVGEEVKIGEHSHSYSISVGETLFSTLKMSKFEDNEVAFVSGRIAFNPNSAIPVLEPAASAKSQDSAVVPTGTDQAREEQTMIATVPAQILPQTTLIGDLRLTALKARLSTLGITADFAGEGVLICGLSQTGNGGSDTDIVSVRKMGRGRVEVAGNVSDVYYTVRRELYGLYAQVAG
ncbi:hypothetical protein DACRYDRAFT_73414 [Dacryopinax primogenitus]|uniref:Cleavage and polyadenylation specificity factor subunit 2 n=1 Tax=Dacryopinax primogenitus (strain DJM 731) TaxID=1858805 RepID=M5G7A7_DACPD|nr:uncharacterized protein DACRYDRAFT_73414 [Dacryopinax primogenitus]EJU06116.1 hypothetical protein DACRYDRAFT_73414 [Dacryopinax primogenitus]